MKPHALMLFSWAPMACSTSTNVPAPDAVGDVVSEATLDVSMERLPVGDGPTEVGGDGGADAATDGSSMPPRVVWESIELPTVGPIGRWGMMIAQGGEGMAFVYGGTTITAAGGGVTFNELWRFDGRGDTPSFERMVTTGDPPRRYCGCLGYLPDTQTVLMVGGRSPVEAPAETWAMREGAWTRVPVASTPPGVIGCAMAWSRARAALYLFGGGSVATGYTGRIWRYDPAVPSWVMLDATGPRPRYDHAFVPLPDGRTILMVAGSSSAQAGPDFYRDVWRFDTMSESWQELRTTGGEPPGRRNPWISIDPDGHGFVMALGSRGIRAEEVLDDAWHLDLRTGRWTVLALAMSPPARGFAQSLPGRGAVRGYVFGGFDNSAPIRDAWRLRSL